MQSMIMYSVCKIIVAYAYIYVHVHVHIYAFITLPLLSSQGDGDSTLRQSLASSSKTATGSSWSPSKSSASEEVAQLRGELKQREGEIRTLRMEKETLAMSGASEGTSTSEAAHLLEEKDKEIRDLTARLQKFHKTAKDFLKIAQHSKQQSETISRLRGNLEQATVCACIDYALQHMSIYIVHAYIHMHVRTWYMYMHQYFLLHPYSHCYLVTLPLLLSRLRCLSYRVRKMNWLQAKMPLLQRFLCYR